MKNKLLFFFIVFPTLVFSQDTARKLLLGQVVTDSLEVENVTVMNKTSHIFAITDRFGKFSIYAREKDTLVFSAVSFRSRTLVVENTDFDYELLKIRLDVIVNELQEVIISPIRLTGNLESDSRKIKVKTLQVPGGMALGKKYYPADSHSKVANQAMPALESPLQGINFIQIAKDIIGLFVKRGTAKPKPEKLSFMTFSDAVKQQFSYHFFTQTLKLANDEIGLFLNFCDTDEVAEKRLLAPGNEFELTDYLIKKSEEFHKNR